MKHTEITVATFYKDIVTFRSRTLALKRKLSETCKKKDQLKLKLIHTKDREEKLHVNRLIQL